MGHKGQLTFLNLENFFSRQACHTSSGGGGIHYGITSELTVILQLGAVGLLPVRFDFQNSGTKIKVGSLFTHLRKFGC